MVAGLAAMAGDDRSGASGCPRSRCRRTIADRTVLLDVAETQGFDRQAARAAVEDDAIAATVRAEERRAYENNVNGVPAMVIDGQVLVPGAQEAETYANVLRKVVSRRG